jgi:hypothetical protein
MTLVRSKRLSAGGVYDLVQSLYHSLKSPACSCASITLLASSYTRITASRERLRNLA